MLSMIILRRKACCLTFSENYYTFNTGSTSIGRGEGPMFIDRLRCKDSSTHIDNCTYTSVPQCTGDYHVYLQCNGKLRNRYVTTILITCMCL